MAFTCEPETQDTTYLWWVNNQSLPVSPRLQLSNGNRTLTLFNVTRNDTASYKCETQNPVSARHSDSVILNVLCEYICSSLAQAASPNPQGQRQDFSVPLRFKYTDPHPWTSRLSVTFCPRKTWADQVLTKNRRGGAAPVLGGSGSTPYDGRNR